MVISHDRFLESLKKVGREDGKTGLFAYQFIEAMQMMLGKWNKPERKVNDVNNTNEFSHLPVFLIDYTDLHMARKES